MFTVDVKQQCNNNNNTVGQGPTAVTVGAAGGCLDIFTLIYPFSPLSGVVGWRDGTG